MFVGSDSLTVEFYGANRQFDWLEILLVYDKSDKHLTLYDSCNAEYAAKMIKSLSLQTYSEAYSLTNEKINMAPATSRKSISCLDNLLPGAAMALAQRRYQTT